MENYIKINDRKITISPSNQQEFDDCVNTCIHILSCLIATQTIPFGNDSKERINKVLELSGSISGCIAKRAIYIIANEEKKVRQNDDA